MLDFKKGSYKYKCFRKFMVKFIDILFLYKDSKLSSATLVETFF